ncbi:Endonuclease/Exonuclease/phosphatase family protein [Caulifigura coniformis]|uniref:Endonuclease/Exonuclease/phosphatase family protein n=1 Tax=Caulifigura coniformis TaxID=2527983 RepID=A0A517SL10_9PLAN|nr:endonuclease/exonuclease/phosphatase family protein [Caulifigura coniformis]QDT56807.1 Endonuclease/Exonuclease/phosphatase family protein [Caulifigura coniformis]
MFRLTFVFALLSVVHLQAAESPLRVKVLCYNIHHGRGTDDKVDIERLARVIQSVDPDLVALQEVDSGVNRSSQINEPEKLGELCKLTPVFGNNIKYDGGDYGNAILSRWPVARHENHKLQSYYPKEQRGLLEVEVTLPEQRGSLLFFATHFDYRGNSPERLPSAELVNRIIATKGNTPAILAGDLNEPPEAPAVRELARVWKRTNDGELPTFPVDTPKRQIDHILVHPPARWRVVETRVLDEAVASDHRAIFSVLKLAK